MLVYLIKQVLFLSSLHLVLALSSCKKAEIHVDLFNKKSNQTPLKLNVSNVEVQNNQIVITGLGFSNVDKLKVKDGNTIIELQIVTKNSSTIVATSNSHLTIAAGKMLDIVFSNAKASSAMSVNFSLCETTLGGYGFSCNVVPNDKDVLSFDAVSGTWKPRSINGLNYLGAWDASGGIAPMIQPAGSYYVISVAGTIGAINFGVGDWLVSNGTLYQKIDNSSEISSVFGRTGNVVAAEGDYNLNLLSDVDLTTAPIAGKVLKFNGSQWVAADDLSGGGVGSVSSSEISDGSIVNADLANNSITDSKINDVAASKISGTLSATQIGVGVLSNSHISASAGIDYSKLNIPDGAILYSKLNIGAGEIPQDRISGLSTAIGAIVEDVIVNAVTTKAPSQNAVYDALAGKLDTTGGVIIPGYLTVATPLLGTDVANKDYVDTTVTNNLSTKLNITGGTLTGDLNIETNLKLKGTSNYVTLRADSATANYSLTFPPLAGANGQLLSTSGSGVLAWTSIPNCGVGEVLKSNGTVFSCVTDSTGGASFSGTSNRVVLTDAGGALATSTVTSTEINYLTGVTSSIQTQLNAKEANITTGTLAQYYRGDKSWQTLNGSVVANTASGNISATNLQAALNELDSEKQATLGFVPLNKAGDNPTSGIFNFSGTSVVRVLDPVGSSDVVNKQYVDGQIVNAANQWTHNSGNVYRLSGNVGIGKASPGSALDVLGSIRISGSTSGYVGFNVPAVAGSTTYTWPSSAPGSNRVLQSDSAGVLSWVSVSGGAGDALVANPLSQFAATSSAQFAGVISDESGTGAVVFTNSPALTGIPTAATAAANTNSTQIATTAFVVGQAALTAPIMNGIQTLGTSLRYAREDHIHPVDNSRSPVAGSTSITTVGTITSGTWNGSILNPAYGGTGQSSLTSGALLIGNGTSSVNFLTPGSNGNILYVTGGAFATGTPNAAGVVDLTSTQTVSGSKTFSNSVRTTKQVSAGSFSGSSDAIDWDNGNVQITSSACSALSFTNMQDGGSYTLIVTNTGTTGCTFPASINGGTAVAWRGAPTLVSHTRTASSHTVYTLVRAGSVIYTSWITGF